MIQSRDRGLSVYLLWEQPGTVVHLTPNLGVLLQSEAACQDAEIPILPHVWRKPDSNTYCLSEDQSIHSK